MAENSVSKAVKVARTKESKGDMLHKTSSEIGRSFAIASLKVPEDSVSDAALLSLAEYAELWREIRSDMEAYIINGGFCEGVADELRRSGKGVKHG